MERVNTKAIWRDRLARLARTNVSIEEFAAREGVKASSLKWWRWRLSSEAKKAQAFAPLARAAGIHGPAFVEVGSSPSQRQVGSANWYEVVLRNGRAVRVPAAFDDSTLVRILSLAESDR